MPCLEVEGVVVRFGGVTAVAGVPLDAEPGRVTGLVGPNGAGKTTLFNVISGLQRPTDGRVRYGGADVTRLRPLRRARAGIARTFQRLEVVASLSVLSLRVLENVRVAVEIRRRRSARASSAGYPGTAPEIRRDRRVAEAYLGPASEGGGAGR